MHVLSEGWFSHRYLFSGFSINPLLNGSKTRRILTFSFNKHKEEMSFWKHSEYWAILPLPVASQKLYRKKHWVSYFVITLRHISQNGSALFGRVKISVCKRQTQKIQSLWRTAAKTLSWKMYGAFSVPQKRM